MRSCVAAADEQPGWACGHTHTSALFLLEGAGRGYFPVHTLFFQRSGNRACLPRLPAKGTKWLVRPRTGPPDAPTSRYSGQPIVSVTSSRISVKGPSPSMAAAEYMSWLSRVAASLGTCVSPSVM